MGFFDWLRDKSEEIKEKIKEKAIEKAEEVLEKVEKTIEALEDLFGLGNNDSYSGSVRKRLTLIKS